MSTLYYQTARGVYHNIEHSHFQVEVKDILFYFTSEYNMTRFQERWEREIQEFNKKIESIYWNNHDLHFDELALIRLYQKIEKRGFLIVYKGNKVNCPDNISFKTKLSVN